MEMSKDNPYLSKQIVELSQYYDSQQQATFDIEGLPIEYDIKDIQSLSNEDYALARKQGFGGSDASILLGVNPYKGIAELIKEKNRKEITEEEKAVGEQSAVMKGRDLEPLIIHKWAVASGKEVYKPAHQYKMKDFPYLKINFDGVSQENDIWVPDEIKVVTEKGERHYNTAKAMYSEGLGWYPIPENHSIKNIDVHTKAALYGIPVYYYTQLQDQMMGLDAPYGYLVAFYERTWKVHAFFVWKDEAVQRQIILKGAQYAPAIGLSL